MNDQAPSHDELIDFVLDELDEQQAAQTAAAIETEPSLQRQTEKFQATLAAIQAAAPSDPEPDFEDRLWKRIEAENATSPNPGRHKTHRLAWLAPLAAAAMVLFAIMLMHGTPGGGLTGDIAWADVLKAAAEVKHFHVTVIFEEATSDDDRFSKIDVYYQQPNLVRAQIENYVQFHNGNETKLYDVSARSFVDLDAQRRTLLPLESLKNFKGNGDTLLPAVLAAMFEGNPPEGTPVKTDAVVAAGGIDVFDYGQGLDRQWIRIWVLRESRLPLKIKMFSPDQSQTMIATFDYIESQPATFFDPERFSETVKKEGLRKSSDILRAGAGRPGDQSKAPVPPSTQLKNVKAGKIVNVLGDADGRFLKESASALQQWQYVQEQLRQQPDDTAMLVTACELLKENGRHEQVRELVAERILPKFLEAPLKDDRVGILVNEYLRELYKTQGLESLKPVIARLEEVRAQPPSSPRDKNRAKRIFDDGDEVWLYSFGWLWKLSEAEKAFHEWRPRPTVHRVIKDKHGVMVVQLKLPAAPSGKMDPRYFWEPRWQAETTGSVLALMPDKDGVVSYRLTGFEEVSAVNYEPIVLISRPSQYSVRTRFSQPIDPAKIENVDSTQTWWDENIARKPSAELSTFDRLSKEARWAYDTGQWAQAIKLYGDLLDLPKDEWPEWAFRPSNAHLELYDANRREYRNKVLLSRLQLGDVDYFLAEVKKLQAELPPLDPNSEDFVAMRKAIGQHAHIRSMQLAAVRHLMEADKFAKAREMMAAIATERPDSLAFPDYAMPLRQGPRAAITTFNPRRDVIRSWREFHTLEWKLADRMAEDVPAPSTE